MCIVKLMFWIFAGLASVFYGWFAVTIFISETEDTYLADRQKAKELKNGRTLKEGEKPPRHWSWWMHQMFVNFFGSIVGWAAAYYLIFVRVPKQENHLIDAFFLLVALVGIFGYLPWRLFNSPLK